ncbi:ComF family protein [Neptuniibacter caesariensis]|uniref:Amidophosphoribosyltransferase n=1 Tax=Neptuniibacter caesariensis TaxID=207954 RepID=A0A7U8C3J8_NEPCE|nr:ComF family protein [Neptuniibacter caesariensis]EAR60840.1 hypothetical protein MED92_16375 [Oceanospirillum sp. MED92] [Neptuniibacter caesariensis]
MNTLQVNLRSLFNQCFLCHIHYSLNAHQPTSICPDCYKDLPRIQHCCSTCALPFSSEVPATTQCGQCLKKQPTFDKVHALFHYKFPIDPVISQLKYEHKTQFVDVLSQLLNTSLPELNGVEAIIPVPLSKSSFRDRGFNQTELLARKLSKSRKIPIDCKLVTKVRETEHQMGLPKEQRKKNLKDAFFCRPNNYKHIALIDDVMTTGTTLEELSRTIKASGVEKVTCLVIARTDK